MMLTFVSSDSLEKLVERLVRHGIEPEGIVDEAFGRSFRVYDPDGLLIQVNEHEEGLYT